MVNLIFFWLDSTQLAIERVKNRVIEGGHNIPETVITRRYHNGLKNLFTRYIPICDYWLIFNNSGVSAELIAEGYTDVEIEIKDNATFKHIKRISHDDQ